MSASDDGGGGLFGGTLGGGLSFIPLGPSLGSGERALDLGDEAKKLLSNPEPYIIAVVFEAFVGGLVRGVIKAISTVVGFILEAFGLAADGVLLPFEAAVNAFAPAADAVLLPVRVAFDVFGGLAAAAGPLAPVVVAVEVFLLVQAFRIGASVLLDVVPGLGAFSGVIR